MFLFRVANQWKPPFFCISFLLLHPARPLFSRLLSPGFLLTELRPATSFSKRARSRGEGGMKEVVPACQTPPAASQRKSHVKYRYELRCWSCSRYCDHFLFRNDSLLKVNPVSLLADAAVATQQVAIFENGYSIFVVDDFGPFLSEFFL